MASTDPFEGSEITTILVVSDMEQSETFYIHQLGAERFRAYGGTSLVIRFLGHWMLLVTGGGPTPDKPETTFAPPADPNAVSHAFTIRVNDCQASYELLRSRGVAFITPPLEQGPETRCFFHDPDGHLFEISEYRAG